MVLFMLIEIIMVMGLNHGNGTFKRLKKKSFDWYKKVIASNGEDLED